MEIFNAAAQRAALLDLAKDLGSPLQRDGCGDPMIVGSQGHVYATPDGFQFVFAGHSARSWASPGRR
jgi:hypothetical protein